MDNEEYLITYAENKRPLRFTPYVIDSDEKDDFLTVILEYVACRANNAESLRKMEASAVFRLIERFATEICYEYSPKRTYGITKADIRSAVRHALDSLMGGGRE